MEEGAGGKFMAIVYKTAQVSATGWTDFDPVLTLKPACEPCYSACQQSLPAELIRGWMAVRMKNAHQKERLGSKMGMLA